MWADSPLFPSFLHICNRTVRRSPGRKLLRRGFDRRRSASASPQRSNVESSDGSSSFLGVSERRQLRMPRAISPPTLHVRANFGQHVASALGERSAVRLARARHMSMDGSPRKAKLTAEERRRLRRPILPKRPTSIGGEMTALEKMLPTDAHPWDRLHVWLVDGQGLPYRPRLWPFEPYVVVTAVGDDTGSSADSPVGAFEFQVRASHMSPTQPIWDEQGLLCYKRGGTTHFRVVVCGSGKVWSGLYGAYVLRPAAALQVSLLTFGGWLWSLVILPVRLARAIAAALRACLQAVGLFAGPSTDANGAAAGSLVTDGLSAHATATPTAAIGTHGGLAPLSVGSGVAVGIDAAEAPTPTPAAVAVTPAAAVVAASGSPYLTRRASGRPSPTDFTPSDLISPHDVTPDGLSAGFDGIRRDSAGFDELGSGSLGGGDETAGESRHGESCDLAELQRELIERQTFELPKAGGPWMDVCVPLPPRCGGTIRLRVRVTAWEERLVHAPPPLPPPHTPTPTQGIVDGASAESEADKAKVAEVAEKAVPNSARSPSPALKWLNSGGAMTANGNGLSTETEGGGSTAWLCDGMTHRVLEGDGDGVGPNRGVLSFYTTAPLFTGGSSALLWLPGRNDAYYHPHVARVLAAHGIDLYVLSYRRMGSCRKLGILDDPMRNSHCASGSFSEYHQDVTQALDFIRSRGAYERILGYGHSTGCPVLLDYVMTHGDGHFDGFIFNSPFLSWGMAGRPLSRLVVQHAPELLHRLRLWTDETELLGGGGASAWALQLWSQYKFDPADRPLYTVPVTIGFCRGINATHRELRRRSRAGVAITRKPFLVFTSMHDDVLEGDELAVAAHAIGPSRTLIQMCHARHDVFVSAEGTVVEQALASLRMWLVSQGFNPTSAGSEDKREE